MAIILSAPKSLLGGTLELIRTAVVLGRRKQLPGMRISTQIFCVSKASLETLKVGTSSRTSTLSRLRGTCDKSPHQLFLTLSGARSNELGLFHRKVWSSYVEPEREYHQRTASLHSFGTFYATCEENQCQGAGRKSKARLNSLLTFAASVFPAPMLVLDMLHATFQVGSTLFSLSRLSSSRPTPVLQGSSQAVGDMCTWGKQRAEETETLNFCEPECHIGNSCKDPVQIGIIRYRRYPREHSLVGGTKSDLSRV